MKHITLGCLFTIVTVSGLDAQAPHPERRVRLEADTAQPAKPRAGKTTPRRRRVKKKSDPRLEGVAVLRGGVPPGSDFERLMLSDDRFAAGLAIFDSAFHESTGLGTPEMNADSCRACHQDPVIGGAGGLELNVSRFGDDGNGTYPFQNLPGGQGLSKMRPPWVEWREEYDPTTATVFEQRQTPSILGAGLIDGISAAAIAANEDPTDRDNDGIYGVARWVDVGGNLEVGRFGWKAQVPRLRDFIMDAMAGELGITTPDDGRGFALLSDADATPDPELSVRQVDLLDYFLLRLPAPERRAGGAAVALGESLFASIGCATCHIPSLAGPAGPVPLYSNLLLHNVMPAGYRGMAEPGADVGFFRTPPLWGIRDTAPYMHDGRASSLSSAVLAHDGEAAQVTAAYQALTAAEQLALLAFLGHL